MKCLAQGTQNSVPARTGPFGVQKVLVRKKYHGCPPILVTVEMPLVSFTVLCRPCTSCDF